MKNIAIVLSGCGFKDGTEITEAVSALVNLSEFGANCAIFSPDFEFVSINHLSDSEGESRSLLVESSRITRGKIQPLSELDTEQFDGVVFPGGFGAAKHLCNWAEKGSACDVNLNAKRVVEEFYTASKPIAAFCIAPVLIAKVLGQHSVSLTIGDNKEVAAEIEKTGAQHEACPVDDFITDRLNKVITTPAYMYGEAKPHEVFYGIKKTLKEFYEMS